MLFGRDLFGGWRRRRYRDEVVAELHAILHFVQDRERVLRSLGSLDKAITELEKNRATELEAAIVLSLFAIETGATYSSGWPRYRDSAIG